MGKFLFFSLLSLVVSAISKDKMVILTASEEADYQNSLYPTISKRKVAVILVDFPDTGEDFKKNYPTIDQAQQYFFSDQLKQYFRTVSYGKFALEGKVFGYFTMPDSLSEDKRNADYIIKTTEIYDLQLDGFDEDDFDAVAFIIFHHEYEQGGLGAAGFANYTVNGKRYENGNVLYNGAFINDSTNTYTRPHVYQFRYGHGADNIVKAPHKIGICYNQAIFAHEYIHLLSGVRNIPHANTCTNNGKADYDTADTLQPAHFLDLEYGNKFDLMGGGAIALSMNGGYRKLLGWCDESNTVTFIKKGKKTARIYPINRKNGVRIVEIRMMDKDLQNENEDYPGYFLEVREPDLLDASLTNEHLLEISKGVLVMKCDGYKTMLLDMSHAENFVIDEQNHVLDYRNMALKPGMVYENNEIKLDNVQIQQDGSFLIDILLKEQH